MPGSVTEPRRGALLSLQYAGLLVKEETRAEQRARYPVSRPEIAASRRYAGGVTYPCCRRDTQTR